ncbi:hypothetical protein [Archaeoglobus sp.]
MGKKKKKSNGRFIVDIKIQEADFKPVLKGRFEVPTIEELVELLKKKVTLWSG